MVLFYLFKTPITGALGVPPPVPDTSIRGFAARSSSLGQGQRGGGCDITLLGASRVLEHLSHQQALGIFCSGKAAEVLGSQPRWGQRNQERFEDPQPSPQNPPEPAGREAEGNDHPHLSLQLGMLGCDGGQGCFLGGAHSHTAPGQRGAPGTRKLQRICGDSAAAGVAHSTEAGGWRK